MENKSGHLCALVTILIWGTTFISTKVLLLSFKPVEILFFRFLLGLLILLAVYPHRLLISDKKQERTFALAGLTGVCLYYLLENIALTYTSASNVGVIISAAPFFTSFLTRGEEKPRINFYIGFLISMAGICLISFSSSKLQLNPIGDILSLLAAFVWACYAVITKKISSFGYNTVQTTRRVFIYGLIFMLPALIFSDFSLGLQRFTDAKNLLNILYLGAGASALCFVTWNIAVKALGALKTSVYIYIVPVITVVTSLIVLNEKITISSAVGTILTLLGLIMSQKKTISKTRGNENECTE
ncbi:MAG: DMT family transporter [Candidatus Metalachnospira sp.]|nr:DMT family transporter [Candidatus Metalachnospira sp.]